MIGRLRDRFVLMSIEPTTKNASSQNVAMPRPGALSKTASDICTKQTSVCSLARAFSTCNVANRPRLLARVPQKQLDDTTGIQQPQRHRRRLLPSIANAMCRTTGPIRRFTATPSRKMAKPVSDATKPAVYTTKTRRTGLLASKKGMMTYFDEWGQQVAVTILKVGSEELKAHRVHRLTPCSSSG